jgi:hypothetical protein
MANRMGFVLSHSQDSRHSFKIVLSSSRLVSVVCDVLDAIVDYLSIDRVSSQLGPCVATQRSVWTRKENTIFAFAPKQP